VRIIQPPADAVEHLLSAQVSTVAGQRFCAFVSKRLAISILRDRNAHKRGAMPLKWHV